MILIWSCLKVEVLFIVYALIELNNWGQININFVNQLGAEANGGFLMVGYHKSSAPISLCPQLIGN